MTRWNAQVAISSCCALLCADTAFGQRGGSDWATVGNDAQRSGWVRTDPKISPESMAKPGFAFLWKQKAGQTGTAACPGGLTTALARPVGVAFPAAPGGRAAGGAMGRGGPAKSGVGAPEEGAVTIAQIAAQANQGGRGGFPGAPGAPNAARGGGGGGMQRMPSYAYALSSDGKLHAMYVSNGEEPNAAVQFIPANANAVGLTVTDGVAYVATINGCGGAPNGIWAMDLSSKQVNSWKAASSISGTSGFAFGPDGTIYAGTEGGELVGLEAKTLKVLATYKAGVGFASTPSVFDYKDKPMVTIAAKDGSIHVLPPALDAPVAKTPAVSSSGEVTAGALATWQDREGTRWILAPAAGSVAAWKLTGEGGSIALSRGWSSRDMVSPLPPMVVNGVVFAVSSGEYRGKDAATPAQRAQKSGKAVLYAIDGKTGKELWNSGSTITSFVHSGGLSGGGSQLYLQTYDGTLYAFGFPIEH